jgi:hypothetical protein
MRGEVAATAAGATALAQHLSNSAGNEANTHQLAAHAKEARATIEKLGNALFKERVLDPYLQFASAEDEEAYRKRERERQKEIDRATALGTPEGLRLATQIMREQVDDAKAHGADRSPDMPAIEQQLQQAEASLERVSPVAQEVIPSIETDASPEAGHGSNELEDVMAALKAAGVDSGNTALSSGPLARTKPATHTVLTGRA